MILKNHKPEKHKVPFFMCQLKRMHCSLSDPFDLGHNLGAGLTRKSKFFVCFAFC